MPTLFDHVLAALVLVVQPLWAARYGPRELEAMKESGKRRSAYLWTIGMQWTYTALLIGAWVWVGRTWTPLGLGLPLGWGLGLVALLGLALAVFMSHQLTRIRTDPRLRAQVREQMVGLEGLLPTTPADVRLVRVVAVTAGVCEELAYRGFLLWYLGAWFSPWLAVPISAVAFGAVHLYQGPRPALKIAMVGLVAALLYLLSGSLWLPMALHVFVDLGQLEAVRVTRRFDEQDGSTGATELPLQPQA